MTARPPHIIIDYTPATTAGGPRWRCHHPTGEADYPDRSVGQLLHLAAGRLADLDALAPRPDGRPHAATLTEPAQAAILARLTAPSVADLAVRLTETLREPMPSAPLAALASLIAEATRAQAQPGYDPLRHDHLLVSPQRLAAGQLRAIAGRLRETLALALPDDPEAP